MKKEGSVILIISSLLFLTLVFLIANLGNRNSLVNENNSIVSNVNTEKKVSLDSSNVFSEKDEMVIDKNSRILRDSLNISDEDSLKISRKIFKFGITDFIELENITYSDLGDIYFTAISDSGHKYDFHLKMNSLEIITISDDTTYLYNAL